MTKIPSLAVALSEIPEFRHCQGKRYELLSILLLAWVAVMCGCRSPAGIADWGRHYGRKWLKRLGIDRRGGPSQATLHRVFKGINYVQLGAALTTWAEQVMQRVGEPCGLEGLAIDGKTLRGSKKQGATDPQLVSVLSHRLEIVITQLAVTDKTNEIPMTEALLEELVLADRVIMIDALLTQRRIAHTILDREGK